MFMVPQRNNCVFSWAFTVSLLSKFLKTTGWTYRNTSVATPGGEKYVTSGCTLKEEWSQDCRRKRTIWDTDDLEKFVVLLRMAKNLNTSTSIITCSGTKINLGIKKICQSTTMYLSFISLKRHGITMHTNHSQSHKLY